MAFDGIVTQKIVLELQELTGSRIDKIFEPEKNNIVLGLYKNKKNYALNISADSSNYRMHLTTHSKPNPKIAPNFCMVLRKHLLGLYLKNIITYDLERIVILEFEGLDDVDDLIQKKLIVELMGKHCNIILLDDSNNIIDSIKHIYQNDNKSYTRTILPHQKYEKPISNKICFLDISNYEIFKNILFKNNISLNDLSKIISNTFTGISKSSIDESLKILNITDTSDSSLETIYNYLRKIIFCENTSNLNFQTLYNHNRAKDYFLTFSSNINDNFNLNFFIDDYYYEKEEKSKFENYKNKLLHIIIEAEKKCKNKISNMENKLKECNNMDLYKLYGELITSNLYKLPNYNIKEVSLENYYDNNNLITIPLDSKFNPSTNAKLFYKKYNKLKKTLEIVSLQKLEAEKELCYIKSIIYEIDNSKSIYELEEIKSEISENILFNKIINKKRNNKQNINNNSNNITKLNFNPIKYSIDNYTFLVGKNNKENDFLTLKYAKKTDLWFHVKDLPGSHGILSLNGNITDLKSIDNNILEKCAKIVTFHSKAKNSSNVPVDVCFTKYVKKPNGAKPGMVIYTNQTTIFVTPENI